MKIRAAIVGGMWGQRRHLFPQADGSLGQCGGPGYCRECNREMEEPYVSDDTKQKIHAVLLEHMGAAAADVGDQDDLRGREDIEWVNLTIALETEFDAHLPDMVIEKSGTIDQIARFIDTVLASRGASPH